MIIMDGTECFIQINIDQFESILNDSNPKTQTMQIVESLGGIDSILREYIRISRNYDDENLLSETRMHQIAMCISDRDQGQSDTIGSLIQTVDDKDIGEQSQTMWDKLYARAKLKDDTFHLSAKDTLLYSFIANEQTVERMMAFISSKIVIAVIFCIGVPWFMAQAFYPDIRQETWFFVLEMLWICFLVLFEIVFISCCNIPALLLIICGFDFWIKVRQRMFLNA